MMLDHLSRDVTKRRIGSKVLERMELNLKASALSGLKGGGGKLSCTTLRVVIPATRSVAQRRANPKSKWIIARHPRCPYWPLALERSGLLLRRMARGALWAEPAEGR